MNACVHSSKIYHSKQTYTSHGTHLPHRASAPNYPLARGPFFLAPASGQALTRALPIIEHISLTSMTISILTNLAICASSNTLNCHPLMYSLIQCSSIFVNKQWFPKNILSYSSLWSLLLRISPPLTCNYQLFSNDFVFFRCYTEEEVYSAIKEIWCFWLNFQQLRIQSTNGRTQWRGLGSGNPIYWNISEELLEWRMISENFVNLNNPMHFSLLY